MSGLEAEGFPRPPMKRLQRMPGASFERPRACKLNDIEPYVAKVSGGCGSDESGGGHGSEEPMSSMGSVARFPKLDECAHFHYEHVELGSLEVSISSGSGPDHEHDDGDPDEQSSFEMRVTSGDACWTLQRSHDNLAMFDKQLHRCIFDRQFSQLEELAELASLTGPEQLRRLQDYFRRFSGLSHDGLNCGPVLNWLQLDNRGRRILVPESDSCPINTPAVAAAYAVRPYQAQAQDEISFQVGDMISVIDMPPAGESSWWRGKHGFAVGFFPAECVAVIGDKLPRHLAAPVAAAALRPAGPARAQPVKPVLRKHGKLIAFFRSFILNRPSRRRLKQSGILRERVFGCDLGEHLLNSGQDVPCVLRCCAEFIERHGLVDGIYRLSGVTSNIQRLRHAFDEDRVPALNTDEAILHDIHSVASLLKMYFRELPNPLCTYQLYSSFVSAVQSASDQERLKKMREAVRKLPPPHYRTLEYLMRHLVRVAARGEETGMTPRNVAIVWAPNLLRCKELEVGGVAALQGVGVQAVVTEFLICYAELIFAAGPSEPTPPSPSGAAQRPKSLAIAANSARLLSLEEARSRSLVPEPTLIEVGPGPSALPTRYHTVIELPRSSQRKRNGSKRSPSLNWRALFGGRPSSKARSEPAHVPEPATAVPLHCNIQAPLRRLRPVKSADSLDGSVPLQQEDGLGPLPGSGGPRTCGHSRSVSHDSYFEQLGDGASAASAPSAASALDLSEIQLSFELEEREMRMLEDEGSGRSRQSPDVSPRRQLITLSEPEPSPGPAGGGGSGGSGGGSKRKRSRLEERLHCDVELRFIDSQSPDQVMVSADVHEMESPSPLPTPGYLPLLSEGSTPMTPAPSPATVSPRISFKSFSLPLDVGEPIIDSSGLLQSCLTKAPRERGSAGGSSSLDLECSLSSSLLSAMEAETPAESSSSSHRLAFVSEVPEIVDQEMTPCERLIDLDSASEMSEATYHGLDISPNLPNVLHPNEDQHDSLDKSFGQSEVTAERASSTQSSHVQDESSVADLDSLMPYEQSYACTNNPNFIAIDPRTESNEDTGQSPNISESTDKWLMTNSTSGSVSPASEINENLLQRISSVTGNLAVEECLSNSSSPKNCQKSICYSLNAAFHVRTNNQSENSYVSCDEGANTVAESNITHQAELLSLMTSDLTSSNADSAANQSICHNSTTQFNTNFENHIDYKDDQDENQMSSWNSVLIDEKLNEANENSKDDSDNQDQNQFCIKETCEEMQINSLSVNQQVDVINKNICDEPEKSQNNCERLIERIPNFNICASLNEYCSERTDQESSDSIVSQTSRIQDDSDAVIPSESAANEPQEMAHVPEMPADNINLDASNVFSSANKTNLEQNKIIHKDTATILQELALQRLSGVDKVDSTPIRRRYDSDIARDRRSFDSEIGREIVREHKIKQELENARIKQDDSLTNSQNQTVQHLPPCLRARHARATRAALSRSLDEAKFNKMTSVGGGSYAGTAVGDYLSRIKQNKDESDQRQQQHGSTPNVGSKIASSASALPSGPERSLQSLNKNLGLDLDDPRCRERIEKYKEERRTFLRDKYRSESFRASLAGSGSATNPSQKSDAAPSAPDANNKEEGEQALLARLKQRASRPSLL